MFIRHVVVVFVALSLMREFVPRAQIVQVDVQIILGR